MKHVFTPIATTVLAALFESESWQTASQLGKLRRSRHALHRKAKAVVVYDRTLCYWWSQIND